MEPLNTINEVWAYNLRKKRGDRTQSAIAEGAGLSLRGYQRLEAGAIPKSPKTISAVARSLGEKHETKLFADPDLQPAKTPAPPTVEGLTKVIEDQEQRMRAIEAKIERFKDLLAAAAPLGDSEIQIFVRNIRNFVAARYPELSNGNDDGLDEVPKPKKKTGHL